MTIYRYMLFGSNVENCTIEKYDYEVVKETGKTFVLENETVKKSDIGKIKFGSVFLLSDDIEDAAMVFIEYRKKLYQEAKAAADREEALYKSLEQRYL